MPRIVTATISISNAHSFNVGMGVLGDCGPAVMPVPLRLELCGLPGAFEVTVTEPLRAPATVGVNVTLMVQLADAASVAPHVLVCAKSPDATILAILSTPVPVFCSVSACAGLVVATC